jgi:hypothetical protein
MPNKPKDPIGWLMLTIFGSAPGPRVTRLFKMVGVSDAQALRADLERFAAMPDLTRLLVAHGVVVSGAAAPSALRAAAACL